jgi:hypothetical protein
MELIVESVENKSQSKNVIKIRSISPHHPNKYTQYRQKVGVSQGSPKRRQNK